MILGMEPKNPVIWTTRCKVMGNYISIYFDIFYEKLASSGFLTARSKKRYFHNDMHCDIPGLLGKLVVTQEPPQFFFFPKM